MLHMIGLRGDGWHHYLEFVKFTDVSLLHFLPIMVDGSSFKGVYCLRRCQCQCLRQKGIEINRWFPIFTESIGEMLGKIKLTGH